MHGVGIYRIKRNQSFLASHLRFFARSRVYVLDGRDHSRTASVVPFDALWFFRRSRVYRKHIAHQSTYVLLPLTRAAR